MDVNEDGGCEMKKIGIDKEDECEEICKEKWERDYD